MFAPMVSPRKRVVNACASQLRRRLFRVDADARHQNVVGRVVEMRLRDRQHIEAAREFGRIERVALAFLSLAPRA